MYDECPGKSKTSRDILKERNTRGDYRIMKMRRDTVTGIVGLIGCAFFFFMTQSVKQPAKLLEPGPRLFAVMTTTRMPTPDTGEFDEPIRPAM